MGMPVIIEVVGPKASQADLDAAFHYFMYVDEKFSTYKSGSEIMRINRGELERADWSADMKEVFELSEKTKQETDGYFDIELTGGVYDPSGLVKGWAIYNAARILEGRGCSDFYIEAGGDIQVQGTSGSGEPWCIGVRHPFVQGEIVKTLILGDRGVATSGTYIRGQHIYNPHRRDVPINEIVSLTVVGPNVYEADRFATAAFVMGVQGISFIESLPGFEGYLIDARGVATMTRGFEKYISHHA